MILDLIPIKCSIPDACCQNFIHHDRRIYWCHIFTRTGHSFLQTCWRWLPAALMPLQAAIPYTKSLFQPWLHKSSSNHELSARRSESCHATSLLSIFKTTKVQEHTHACMHTHTRPTSAVIIPSYQSISQANVLKSNPQGPEYCCFSLLQHI